jgi:hypothetical protein
MHDKPGCCATVLQQPSKTDAVSVKVLGQVTWCLRVNGLPLTATSVSCGMAASLLAHSDGSSSRLLLSCSTRRRGKQACRPPFTPIAGWMALIALSSSLSSCSLRRLENASGSSTLHGGNSPQYVLVCQHWWQ